MADAQSETRADFDTDNLQAETWRRLRRRATIVAVLLMGLMVGPFLVMLTWINWAIVFRGKDWSLDVTHPGIPEAAAGLVAAVGAVFFIRALVFCLIGCSFGRAE
jgi:hypothetical protein